MHIQESYHKMLKIMSCGTTSIKVKLLVNQLSTFMSRNICSLSFLSTMHTSVKKMRQMQNFISNMFFFLKIQRRLSQFIVVYMVGEKNIYCVELVMVINLEGKKNRKIYCRSKISLRLLILFLSAAYMSQSAFLLAHFFPLSNSFFLNV